MSPIKELSQPKDYIGGDDGWTMLANNSKVNKSWEALMEQAPENTQRCYEHLHMQPMQRIRGRVFPLKHKKYRDEVPGNINFPVEIALVARRLFVKRSCNNHRLEQLLIDV